MLMVGFFFKIYIKKHFCFFLIKKYIKRGFKGLTARLPWALLFPECTAAVAGAQLMLGAGCQGSRSHGRVVMPAPAPVPSLPGEAQEVTLETKARRAVKFCSCWELSLDILLGRSTQPGSLQHSSCMLLRHPFHQIWEF